MESNKWFFQDGDVVLTSDDQEQLELAGQWIAHLTAMIRTQAIEEYINGQKEEDQNGRTNVSDQYEQPELSN